MKCPNCACDQLKIRKNEGFERVLIFLTGLREYVCVACDQSFRAPDRRRFPRERDAQSIGAALTRRVA